MRLPRSTLAALALGAVTFAVLRGLFTVAPDRAQGDLQRIMYLHVPAAWIAYLAFFLTLVGSVLFLLRGSRQADRLALASAEVGLVFTAVTIVTGSIWGRGTWGVWWDWDPRLTTTALLLAVYAGYVLLRASLGDSARGSRGAAVYGILAFATVPVVHLSVLWWRSLHQPPTIVQLGSPPIDDARLVQLLLSLVAFTLLFAFLLGRRMELERRREALRAELLEAG